MEVLWSKGFCVFSPGSSNAEAFGNAEYLFIDITIFCCGNIVFVEDLVFERES